MSYFLGKIYQSVKVMTALSGTVGSITAITYGALMSGGTVFIVGGSLCLANCIFNFIEIGKVNFDIKKQLDMLKQSLYNFSQENKQLQDNIESLSVIRKEFINENERLTGTIEATNAQLDNMKGLLTNTTSENNKLKENLELFLSENEKLKGLLGSAQTQLTTIEGLKDQYESEIKRLNTNNTDLAKEIQQQNDIIQDSKKLIKTLAQFGDKYNDFATSVGSLDKIDNSLSDTSVILRNLVNKLEGQTFDEIDINHDGVISRQEFEKAVGK